MIIDIYAIHIVIGAFSHNFYGWNITDNDINGHTQHSLLVIDYVLILKVQYIQQLSPYLLWKCHVMRIRKIDYI